MFEVAVNFDGAAGYEEIDDKIGEFAVSLRLYDTLESEEKSKPLQTLEICPTTSGMDIHDLLLNLVDEAANES